MIRGTKITCPHCNGSGATVLASVYERTLKLLCRKGKATGSELSRIDECKATAMNNRLAALERHGLVTSHWEGRRRIYEIRVPFGFPD